MYLSYIRVALGVSDEVRRQIARFCYLFWRRSLISLRISSVVSFSAAAAAAAAAKNGEAEFEGFDD